MSYGKSVVVLHYWLGIDCYTCLRDDLIAEVTWRWIAMQGCLNWETIASETDRVFCVFFFFGGGGGGEGGWLFFLSSGYLYHRWRPDKTKKVFSCVFFRIFISYTNYTTGAPFNLLFLWINMSVAFFFLNCSKCISSTIIHIHFAWIYH